MSTEFPDLFNALAAPFEPNQVKVRKHDGARYVTARVVMNRLDSVVGPENWTPAYERWGEDAVLCRLTIVLPDGRVLTKQDIGAYTSMGEKNKSIDPGDDDKGGVSDALKRAAVLFGVARYLYNDGVPEHRPRPNNNSGYKTGQYASPATIKLFRDATLDFCAKKNAEWLDEWTKEEGLTPGIGELLHPTQVTRHLLKWAIRTGRLVELPFTSDPETGKPTEKVSVDQSKGYVAIVFDREPQEVAAEAEAYYRQQAQEARRAWGEEHEVEVMAGREPGEEG